MFALDIKARYIACIALAVVLGTAAGAQDPVVKTGTQLPRGEAQKILDRYYALIHGAKTIQFSMQNELEGILLQTDVKLKKPLQYRGDQTNTEKGTVWHYTNYMVGNVHYLVNIDGGKFATISDRVPNSPEIVGLEPFNEAKRPEYTLSGSVWEATLGGKPAYMIKAGTEGMLKNKALLYVDRKTLIPLGWVDSTSALKTFTKFWGFKVNAPLSDDVFVWQDRTGYDVTDNRKK